MPKRILVAILGSLPVAVVAAVSLGFVIYLGDAVSTVFFWIVWGGSTLYAVREIELKRIFGRTAIAYAVAAFSLPLTAAIFAVTAFGAVESSMSEAKGVLEGFIWIIFGAALLEIFLVIAAVAGVFGVVTGIVAVLLARRLLKGQDTEPRQPAGLSVRAAIRGLPTGGLRQIRLDNKATVLGLGLVALCLAGIAGIAVYGILVSTDSSEPTLTVVPTLVPAISTPSPATAAEPTPTRNPEPTYTPLPKATPYPAGDADLNKAIRSGDVEYVQAIINSGESVNVSDTDGDPFLHLAIWRNHIDVLRILVDAGADIDARDSDGNPMLREAVWREHIEIVSLLIEAGVDVNAKDAEGDPILYEAIWRGHTEIVRLLVKAGTDVNAKDSDGNPMLYEAIWRNHAEIAQILVNAGADADARDSDGDPLLYTAIWRNHTEAVRILVGEGADVNAYTAAGESMLSVALQRSTEEIAQILKDAGAAG